MTWPYWAAVTCYPLHAVRGVFTGPRVTLNTCCAASTSPPRGRAMRQQAARLPLPAGTSSLWSLPWHTRRCTVAPPRSTGDLREPPRPRRCRPKVHSLCDPCHCAHGVVRLPPHPRPHSTIRTRAAKPARHPHGAPLPGAEMPRGARGKTGAAASGRPGDGVCERRRPPSGRRFEWALVAYQAPDPARGAR